MWFFFFQAEDGIRGFHVTGVQTCALPICTLPLTPIADRAKGNYSETSGSIVINGKVLQGLAGCDRYGSEPCYISAYDAATGRQRSEERRVGKEWGTWRSCRAYTVYRWASC